MKEIIAKKEIVLFLLVNNVVIAFVCGWYVFS